MAPRAHRRRTFKAVYPFPVRLRSLSPSLPERASQAYQPPNPWQLLFSDLLVPISREGERPREPKLLGNSANIRAREDARPPSFGFRDGSGQRALAPICLGNTPSKCAPNEKRPKKGLRPRKSVRYFPQRHFMALAD